MSNVSREVTNFGHHQQRCCSEEEHCRLGNCIYVKKIWAREARRMGESSLSKFFFYRSPTIRLLREDARIPMRERNRFFKYYVSRSVANNFGIKDADRRNRYISTRDARIRISKLQKWISKNFAILIAFSHKKKKKKSECLHSKVTIGNSNLIFLEF